MKKTYMIRALLLVALSALNCGVYAQTTTTTFIFTGSMQTWTVPPGVTSILFNAKGGEGGNNAGVSMSDRPGYGGCITGTLAVTPGTVLNIYVGGVGGNSTTSLGGLGGYNGGGPGGLGYTPYAGGGGGGASDIRIGGIALTDRVVVAAGGGGAGGNWFLPTVDYDRGGDGGGTTGEAGSDGGTIGGAGAGGGGTPGGGGTFGTYSGWGSGTAGGLGIGGSAGLPSGGGGGGGGMYGGGGGSWAGGGGGSNYADAFLTSAVTHTRGCNTSGNGVVSITVTCAPPVAGVIVGPGTICTGTNVTYTDPTGTSGGTWSSSAPLVATINPLTGVATGISPGVATFTYAIVLSCGNASTTTTITVNPSPAVITGPDSVCNDPSLPILLMDATPGGTWSTVTTSVATIGSSTGILTAASPGTTSVIYTAGGCTSTVVVTVNPLPAAIVGPSQICHGTSVTLTDPTPGGVWSSNVIGAVSIGSATGIAFGAGPGFSAANIYYTLPTGCVSPAHFMSVTVPPVAITGPNQVCESNAIILTELVGGGTWTTSSGTIATVTSGIVTGLVPGTVTITYTTPVCPPVNHIVTVNPLPAIITGSTAICTGLATTLYDVTPGGSWSSGNPAISVSSSGDVTSTTTGITGSIYYTLPTGCYVFTMVNVSVPPAPIVGPDSICQNATATLACTPPAGTAPGIWSSTNLAVAQIIDSSGVVTGISAGTVNISYTLPTGCFAEKAFIVEPPVPGSVTVSDSPGGIICEGTPITFTATPVNGGTPTYIWKKFSVDLGGIDSTGVKTYTPIHGDVFECVMFPHGVCALHDSVIDTFYANVYPVNVVPTITISTTGPDTVSYVGEIVTFYSVVTWGGTSPTYQWYKNNVAIAGANASSYTTAVYAKDTFYCQVVGNPPCESSTPGPGISNLIIIHDFLGVNQLANGSNNLNLFPNPNNGSFTLEGKLASTSGDNVYLEVSNMLGQVIYSGFATPQNGTINAQIKLDNIAEGAYLLRVNTDTGIETFHFVKSK